jgi:hypothetical protein
MVLPLRVFAEKKSNRSGGVGLLVRDEFANDIVILSLSNENCLCFKLKNNSII